MGIFNPKPKQQLKNVNGYIIDELTGTLVDVPQGLSIYIIPREVKKLNPDLSLMNNKPLSKMSEASEIIFEDGSIEKLPDGYFTFGNAFPKLKKITLPYGIKSLGNNSIDATKTEYNLPQTLNHLGNDMYPEVQKLVIESNIKSLSPMFASHDTNLTCIEVAGTIKELPSNFVNQCKNLKTLILHEGVETAGDDAFRNLNSLEYVELPDSFKIPFQTSMETRNGSNKRGNSHYDNSNFDKLENNILIIKKTHNGVPYTFHVRRGDFSSILFQNETVIIESNNPKQENITINLSNLTENSICKVNIREQQFDIEMKTKGNDYFSQETKQEKDPTAFKYTEEEILRDFQELYKKSIISSISFQNINDSMIKMKVKKILFEKFNDWVQQGVKVGKKYTIDGDYLFQMFEEALVKIKKEEQSTNKEEKKEKSEFEKFKGAIENCKSVQDLDVVFRDIIISNLSFKLKPDEFEELNNNIAKIRVAYKKNRDRKNSFDDYKKLLIHGNLNLTQALEVGRLLEKDNTITNEERKILMGLLIEYKTGLENSQFESHKK
jgi:hypothetical protein